MRKLFITIICTALLSGCSQHSITEHHPHWSYQGEKSPAHWGEIAPEFAVCNNGHLQSPVNLSSRNKQANAHLQYHYSPTYFTMENNGHAIQLTPQTKSANLILDNKQYILQQFHIHTPSEHTIDNKQFPMELHFVHTSDDGEITVIAVMFEVGKENPQLTQILAHSIQTNEKVILPDALNVQDLFPKDLARLRLKGSLTTPPCTEGVNWIVLQNPLQASSAQLKAMEKMIGIKNNRPLQPLGSRVVVSEK